MADSGTSPTFRPTLVRRVLLVAGALMLTAGCSTASGGTDAAATPSPWPVAGRKLQKPETLLGLPSSSSRELTGVPESRLEDLKRQVGELTSAVAWAYGGETEDADAVLISGVSGTVADPAGAVSRALQPYRISDVRPVAAGPLGGEARCGRGRTEEGSHLTVCGWADPQTIGVVALVSSHPQGDLTSKFHQAREEMQRPPA
ncbi:hypothetical protein GA0074696_0566 [Micromonospora purpureochromogenes]|uniref:Lipoprotein n=1 Tax=Micromonospora purpureochromogenes TaxID=47872 RepID=A0A1C4UR99_9ACTN|nr:hypothetical protein [Micromonospora purpureochromogenes]SCE74164.1 hypothetical protein GA0074696_0566 [Micromonospora purpureochromogenes]